MRIDVMVDLETLGTDSSATIFQIAAVGFDILTGGIGSEFCKTADIAKNASYEMTVSGSTLKWWMTDDKRDTFVKLINQGMGSSSELLDDFTKWLQGLGAIGDVYLWGNGINFDNRILSDQMGSDYPIHFRRDRDVRTIVDIYCMKYNLTEKELRDKYYNYDLAAHDAFNDVRNQVRMVSACYRDLTEQLTGDADNVTEETIS